MRKQVLIVGAGPTGLALALCLKRLDIAIRIVDMASAPGATSRAMVVHARSLEIYDQLGIAQAIVDAGVKGIAINAHLNYQRIARIPFGDFGEGLSPYPFALVLPQEVHERLLQNELRKLGVTLEWGKKLIYFQEVRDDVRVSLKSASGEETLTVDYLCGCDGVHSTIRRHLGIGFPGATHKERFYVADALVGGPMADDEIHFAFFDRGIFGIFPLRPGAIWRLVGVVPHWIKKEAHEINYADLANGIYQTTGLEISRVYWFSAYHIHHRVADLFCTRRVFLLGDACHIHSPAGGQGMNTGIGDAANLAWKLAAVLQHRGGQSLLDSYQDERIDVARRIVSISDRIFKFEVSPLWPIQVARRQLVALAPRLMQVENVRHFVFRTISQTGVNYRRSPISAGAAGGLHAGDRLPWVRFGESDNYAALRSLDWQVHIYGAYEGELHQICADYDLGFRQYPVTHASINQGFKEDVIYLVRPDGYIGFIAQRQDIKALRRYLARMGLRPG